MNINSIILYRLFDIVMELRNLQTMRPQNKSLVSHNRSQTVEKLSKICHTQTSESKDSFDPYTSFIYRDPVTRHRYEISNLKNRKRSQKNYTKALKELQYDKNKKTQNNEEFQYYSEELNFLQSIRQNRNKELMAEYVKLRQKNPTTSEFQTGSENKQDKEGSGNNRKYISKIKNQIQAEVMHLNQQFLREYLYHEQPFNKRLIQINKYSNSKVIDQQKINKLKKNLIDCLAERKQRENDPHFRINKNPEPQNNKEIKANQKKWKNWVTTYYERKQIKQNINNELDNKFDEEWRRMEQEITQKIKFQGEFNWKFKPSKTLNKYKMH